MSLGNKFAKESKEIKFKSNKNSEDLNLGNLVDLDDKNFQKFICIISCKRIGRDRFLRNVLIAIGNSGEKSLSRKTISKLKDQSPLVRGAAIWALHKLLEKDEFDKIKNTYIGYETDQTVKSEWKVNIY